MAQTTSGGLVESVSIPEAPSRAFRRAYLDSAPVIYLGIGLVSVEEHPRVCCAVALGGPLAACRGGAPSGRRQRTVAERAIDCAATASTRCGRANARPRCGADSCRRGRRSQAANAPPRHQTGKDRLLPDRADRFRSAHPALARFRLPRRRAPGRGWPSPGPRRHCRRRRQPSPRRQQSCSVLRDRRHGRAGRQDHWWPVGSGRAKTASSQT